MKRLIALLSLSLFLSFSGYAQCDGDCVEADMNFTPASSYNDSHPDWQVSHGTPTVNVGSAWMWSYNNLGEGMNYSGYNFVQGRQYCISFQATTVTQNGATANANAFFRVAATQGNVTGTGFNIPALPAGSQVIANQNWNATSPPNSSTYTYTFTASQNFNNLWFHPQSATLPQIELTIRNLVICELRDPCEDVSFNVQLSEQNNDATGITLLPTGVPAGSQIQFRIIRNGVNVYSGPPVSYLGQPGNYTICMEARLPDGTRCRKCFSFCIEGWRSLSTQGGDEVIEVEIKQNAFYEFPEELKEQHLEGSSLENKARVFPNPTSGKFNVEVDSDLQIVNAKVYNTVSGRSVGKLDIKANTINIDIAKETVGVYDVAIELADGNVIHKKIILQK